MIDFLKSETLRSFYRTAKNKGWVKEDKITKTASYNSLSLSPSDSLFRDVCVLADALRTKGYIKQAEAIEEKFMAYKIAEKHLYNVHDEDGPDLLEYAHPEGSPKIVDSVGGHGIVENDLSSHKKILDVVNKKPTGKLASIADQIKKKAQALPEFEGWVDPAADLKDDFTINNLLVNLHHSLKGIKQSIGPADRYQFNIDALLQDYAAGGSAYTKLFETISSNVQGDSYKNIINYLNLLKVIYKNGNVDIGNIVNIIKQTAGHEYSDTGYKNMFNYLNAIAPGKFNMFIDPKSPNTIWVNKWARAFLDNNMVNNLAQNIHNYAMEYKKSLNLDHINQYVQFFITRILNGLNSINLPKNVEIENSNEADKMLVNISNVNRIFRKVLDENNILPQLKLLMDGFGFSYGVVQRYVAEFAKGLNSLFKHVSKKVDDFVAGPQVDAIIHRFVKASELFNNFVENNPDHKYINDFKHDSYASYKLAKTIKEHKNRSFRHLKNVLMSRQGLGDDAKDLNDLNALDMFSQQWLTAARAAVGVK